MEMKLYQLIALLAVLGLTVASGVIQGRMTNRWGVSSEARASGDKLQEIPSRFGSWTLVEPEKMDKTSQAMLETFGYMGGLYENRDTGAQVLSLLIVGPPGTVAVHTPEICMGSRDYELVSSRKAVFIREKGSPAKSHRFWAVRFKRTDVEGQLLGVYYAWTVHGTWAAEEDGRWKFAGSPYLYKLQVQCLLPPLAGPEEADACQQFLAEFIPAAAPHLVTSRDR
jgi:hypothetical protein